MRSALQDLPRARLNSGNSEIRNWICAGGALEHLDLRWVTYCPGYRTPAGTGTGLCFAQGGDADADRSLMLAQSSAAFGGRVPAR